MNLEQKSIYFVDDYLNNEEIAFVDDYFKRPVWEFGHCTDQSDERLFKGRWFVANLEYEKFFNEHLLKKIEKTTDCKWEVLKVYANGQTILNGGDWHVDAICNPPDPIYFTVLLYVSDIDASNVHIINGCTEFRPKHKITTIEPLKNRMVLFDSTISHRGNAPTIPGFLRISLAWKLRKIA